MIIAGAGGHALELLDILISKGDNSDLYFYDDKSDFRIFQNKYPILKSKEDLQKKLSEDNRFLLGVGGPKVRFYFYNFFASCGGVLNSVKANTTSLSNFNHHNMSDIFSLCFIGASTKIGTGSLIHTGSQIHHEVKIGDFTEINPGAILLGKSVVGNFCSIGAGAIILPKITIGNNVLIGAGTVVTKNIPDNSKVIGVPGKIIFDKPNH